MPHIAGGKITSSHTTVISAAEAIVKQLQKDSCVSKISLGNISSKGASSGSGIKRVKIIDEDYCILIVVSENSANQQLRAYFEKNNEAQREAVRKSLASFARENEYDVSFLDRRG